MDIEELRRLSAQGEIDRRRRIASERAEQEQREREKRQMEAESEKRRIELLEHEAAEFIRSIPAKIESAARNGFRSCEILQVHVDPNAKEGQYKSLFRRSVSASVLERVEENRRILAMRVYTFLQTSGLKPRLSLLEGHTADEQFKARDGTWTRWRQDMPGNLWIHADW